MIKSQCCKFAIQYADVAELADALVSGSSEAIHVGSSPVVRTIKIRRIGYKELCLFCVFYCFLGVFLPFQGIKTIFLIEEAHLPRVFALSVDGFFVSIKTMGNR